MTGLIPLRLQPAASGNRTSVVFSNPPSFPGGHSTGHSAGYLSRPSHARHSSTGSASLSLMNFPSSAPKSRALKHVSQPILPSLPVLPYTAAEWKRTIAEIKRQHVAKRFRACSARCIEILEHIKDASTIEPAHLIYLHFYAANSLEMCARPFSSTTPARTHLLSQARKHYDQAAALIQKAEQSVATKTRSCSPNSSSSYGSLHSPSGSVSSGTWSTPTTASSPTNSVCSFDDLMSMSSRLAPVTPQQEAPRKAKKTVSFSLPKEEVFKFPEPYIRPDSPTLGFDDAYFTAPITRQELPAVPKQPETLITPSSFDQDHDHDHDHMEYNASEVVDEGSPQRIAHSVHRYCETLMSLKSQLASHSSNLDALMETPTSLSINKGERRLVINNKAGPVSEELRALDRKARIERLRQNGWQRKRFDASRYEDLCNNVMAELS